jgi:hypothetical protein
MPSTTRIRDRHFTPWLLGWSRWEIILEHDQGDGVIRQELAYGRWRWRSRKDRYYREFVFEVAGVSDMHCDETWMADKLVKQ